jgi:hypothetical protein
MSPLMPQPEPRAVMPPADTSPNRTAPRDTVTLATEHAPVDGSPPIGEMAVAPQNSHPSPSKPSPPIGHDTTGLGQAKPDNARAVVPRAPDVPLSIAMTATDSERQNTLPHPSQDSPKAISRPDAEQPHSSQSRAVDDGGFNDASSPRRQPRRHDLAITAQRAGTTPEPTLKIGTVEVRVLPAPLATPSPPENDARAAAPSSSSTLSRGFGSLFGLRQG